MSTVVCGWRDYVPRRTTIGACQRGTHVADDTIGRTVSH